MHRYDVDWTWPVKRQGKRTPHGKKDRDGLSTDVPPRAAGLPGVGRDVEADGGSFEDLLENLRTAFTARVDLIPNGGIITSEAP